MRETSYSKSLASIKSQLNQIQEHFLVIADDVRNISIGYYQRFINLSAQVGRILDIMDSYETNPGTISIVIELLGDIEHKLRDAAHDFRTISNYAFSFNKSAEQIRQITIQISQMEVPSTGEADRKVIIDKVRFINPSLADCLDNLMKNRDVARIIIGRGRV